MERPRDNAKRLPEIMTQPTEYKGTFYFPSHETAKSYAESHAWSTARIIKYGRGWAIQAGPSGNYAGPGEVPKPWAGLSGMQDA